MKSMKKALSLFLALSMLMTVCAVNILAEDTVTLTVPNGNFANTCDANGTLPDGWRSKPLQLTAGNASATYWIVYQKGSDSMTKESTMFILKRNRILKCRKTGLIYMWNVQQNLRWADACFWQFS